MLDTLGHLRQEKSTCIVEAEEELILVEDVGSFFLEVIFEFIDGFALERLVEGSREDPAYVSAVDLLVDVGGCVVGRVRGSLIRVALEGGVR